MRPLRWPPPVGSLDLSEVLIREVEAADVIVIGTPMHNLTIRSALKAWIDQILRVGRTMKSTPAGRRMERGGSAGTLMRMRQVTRFDGPDSDSKDQYFTLANGEGIEWLGHRYSYSRRG